MNKRTVVFLTVAVAFAFFMSAFAWADSVGNCTVTNKAGKKQDMTMYVKGDLTMTEIKADGQVVKSVIDKKNKKVIMIMDSAKMCMTQPYSQPSIEPGMEKAGGPEGSIACKWNNTAVDASKLTCPAGYRSM